MENREIAIQLSNVKKMYKLGQIGGGSLTRDLQSWWARVRGKDDPNTIIGTDRRLIGQTFMALNGIDLTVYKGEALGIIGGNGAGKSTLLKLLSRVTAPTEGEIDIYGRVASMLEVGTGFHGEMTGRENVYMNGAILGMTREEIDAKMEDIIEFSEVREFIDTPVKRYSSGMYVKLAFSVAAHLDSEIMIMDEVLAVGDMAFQKKCLDKMRDAAKKQGRTVLYVSHNMNTIRQLCDRCVVLDKGKVVFEGDVESSIDIYMNRQLDESVLRTYADYKRPAWMRNLKIKLLEAEYLGKVSPLFDADEKTLLRLKWENMQNIENLGLRVEVLDLADSPQATYVLFDFYSGNKDASCEAVIELDSSMFMEGDYKTTYTFFLRDEFGNNVNADCVPGLCFQKTVINTKNKLVWDSAHWGRIQLPSPHLIHLG